MKKAICIICTLAVLMSLTACGKGSSSAPDPADFLSSAEKESKEKPEKKPEKGTASEKKTAEKESSAETSAAEVPAKDESVQETPAQEMPAEPSVSAAISFDPYISLIQANACYTYGLTPSGTLIASSEPFVSGDNVVKTLTDYLTWANIVNFSSNSEAIAAVLSDGTVLMCGGLVDEMAYSDFSDVSSWTDMVQAAMGKSHLVGLMSDGSVKISGAYYSMNQDITTGFIQVECGCEPMGVRQDGTVVVWNWGFSDPIDDVNSWTDITYVSSTFDHIVGLRRDGTVVACGSNDYGQCDVSEWTDIIAVSAGLDFTVGLKSDGTIVFCGSDNSGAFDFSGWSDIIAIDAGYYHCVGLRSDGTVLSAGADYQGQLNTADWMLK